MLLEIVDLRVKYGSIEVLHGINLKVREGEIVTILGANGAGKSTTLLAISGLVKASSGAVYFDKNPLHKLPAHKVVQQGIAQVPEGRRMFGTLTVQENLSLGAYTCKDSAQIKRTREWIYEMLPVLAERRNQLAGTLSGGEQQMLAIGRALMSQPKILLLDEPSLGLAPLLVKMIFQTLEEINETGVTMVLVEQNARAALKLANRGYVMEVGNIVLEDDSASLMSNSEVQAAYFGGTPA
ncbi:ABC transporter ATP-binding protein [Desulfoferrobacter suflitae]|uniref:ABC transporter ATP-binding protein n=1 Tax=Desulfoferrobacter suflitae TaxID=2865782 RepID=UPI0021642BC3|nr:ABC transporter ATP-binding protein [Desulfoferrobacter suflitae]MCK8601506.1 ABC transporter ATP-binding protein [Desulfoferrobacter suflitae]